MITNVTPKERIGSQISYDCNFSSIHSHKMMQLVHSVLKLLHSSLSSISFKYYLLRNSLSIQCQPGNPFSVKYVQNFLHITQETVVSVSRQINLVNFLCNNFWFHRLCATFLAHPLKRLENSAPSFAQTYRIF